jgi:hypothetical protein
MMSELKINQCFLHQQYIPSKKAIHKGMIYYKFGLGLG